MERRLEEGQRWMAKARSSLTAAKKLLEESLFACRAPTSNADGFEWRQKSDYDVYWLATREEGNARKPIYRWWTPGVRRK